MAAGPVDPDGHGAFFSHLLCVAAQLNLADYLTDSPKTAEELAKSTATDVQSLYRLMRTLASLGLFTEDAAHRFSLRPFNCVAF
jgi:DNA-binding IclR family transcriptional regulator